MWNIYFNALISRDNISVLNQIEKGPFTTVTTILSHSTWGGKGDVKRIDGRGIPKHVHDSVVTDVKGYMKSYSMLIIFFI